MFFLVRPAKEDSRKRHSTPGTDATAQLRAMVSHSLNQLRSLGVKPENMERVMTVASLVEGEARRVAA